MLLTLLNIRGRCTEPRKKTLVHHLWRLWREVETLSVRGSIGLFVIPFRFTYTMQMSCISWLVLLRMRSCSRLILIHILEFSSTHIQIGRSLTGNAPSWPKTVRYPRHNLDTAAQNEKHYAVCHPAECLPGFAVAWACTKHYGFEIREQVHHEMISTNTFEIFKKRLMNLCNTFCHMIAPFCAWCVPNSSV